LSSTGVIVVGNEKGGAGKSTVAVHVMTALLYAGAKVSVLDLDLRQSSVGTFCRNRLIWQDSAKVELPNPNLIRIDDGAALAQAGAAEQMSRFDEMFAKGTENADYLIIDTPGGDTPLSRAAHGKADLIVTPMNDSFVDFGMLGVIDPVTLDLQRPGVYAETVWNARKARAVDGGGQINWVVLRNRLASTEARNRKRVDDRVQALAKRVGFTVGSGLRDRVIYRELYPFGLTVADLSASVRPVPIALTHVAARQELRNLMQAIGLGDWIHSDK
jgi:chromosome partitioning protein